MNPSNLNEYYKSQGKVLPTVSERAADATKAGISGYTGTASQNTQLLNYYLNGSSPAKSATQQSVPSPYTITSDAMKPVNQVPLANPNVDPNTYLSSINSVANDLNNQVSLQQAEVDAWREKARSGSSTVSNLQALLGGKTEDINKTYQDTGVTALYGQLSDLNAQATGLRNEAAAIPIQIQNEFAGRGVTEGGVAPISSARLRDNALKSLSLGQQAAIANSNYDKAKVYADSLIEAKYSKITAEIEAAKTNLDNLRQFDLTPAENRLLKTQEMAQNAKLTALQAAKDNEKSVQDLIIKAAGQGADRATLKRAGSAKTPQEAAIALGQWAGDYWQNKALEDAYKKQQSANAQTQIVNGNYVGAMEKYDATPAQLAQAIAMKETNGGRNITAGASGELASKYQYMPETWRTTSQAYNLAVNGKNSPLPFSLDVEDKVTEWQIAKWKAEGKTNAQIFAMWNGGPGAANNWQNRVGVNSKGVKYDVPSYVSDASKFLADIVGVGGIAGNQQFSPEVLGYVEQINSGKLKLVNVPQNMRGQVASAMSTIESNDPVKKAQIDIAVEGVNKLDAALNRIGGLAGLGGANIAGSNWLSRVDFSNFMTGDKNVVLGYIDNILSESTLNQLIKAKEAGATFGALSNQELGLLERSATVLNKWAIRDSITGALEGFSVPEENVIKELNTIKSKLQMAIPSDYQAPASEADKALDTFEKIKNSGSSVPEDVFLSNLPGINK